MTYLLDTNACIHLLRNSNAQVLKKYKFAGAASVALCSIVKAELYYGADKSLHKSANRAAIDLFCSPLVSLPFDDPAAESYGQIRAQLELRGTPIGPNDLMIAAIALANKLILVTHNTREFSRVANLQIEDWEL